MAYTGKQLLIIILLLIMLSACASNSTHLPLAEAPLTHTIYVVNYAWHTGIIIDRADLPIGKIPESEDFPDADYLEFGWGDREYYPARDPGIGRALLAGLVPTDSVMQMAGLPRTPEEVYPGSEVHVLQVTTAGFNDLIEALDAVFDRAGEARSEMIHVSASERMRYYPAHGHFHMFNTCNTWTARKLAIAGVPISATGVATAQQLMRRLRPLAK